MAKKKSSANKGMVAAEIGAGVLAAAAAGAGYYFYGSEGAKHRAAAAKWANDMKKDVVKEAKKVQKLDQKAMAAIIDRATKAYQGARNVSREDLARAAKELKQNWKEIAGELQTVAKKSGSAAKHAAKTATASARRAVGKTEKAAKKVVKKASKKAAKKR
jgi:hypothetical protein